VMSDESSMMSNSTTLSEAGSVASSTASSGSAFPSGWAPGNVWGGKARKAEREAAFKEDGSE